MTRLSKSAVHGNGHSRRSKRGYRETRGLLARCAGDLRAAQELKREHLKSIRALRSEVYRTAAAAGIPPIVLRAIAQG